MMKPFSELSLILSDKHCDTVKYANEAAKNNREVDFGSEKEVQMSELKSNRGKTSFKSLLKHLKIKKSSRSRSNSNEHCEEFDENFDISDLEGADSHEHHKTNSKWHIDNFIYFMMYLKNERNVKKIDEYSQDEISNISNSSFLSTLLENPENLDEVEDVNPSKFGCCREINPIPKPKRALYENLKFHKNLKFHEKLYENVEFHQKSVEIMETNFPLLKESAIHHYEDPSAILPRNCGTKKFFTSKLEFHFDKGKRTSNEHIFTIYESTS